MFDKRLWGLTSALLAFACAKGGDDTEIVHEKEGSTEAAALAGWEIEPSTLKSDHRLGNDLELAFEVEAPDTARKFRLRFARISMERNYDFLVVRDQYGNELERITGTHRNYVTRTINGTKATIVLETDYSVSSWGFELDEIRHRGCVRETPSATPMRAARNCTDLRDSIRDLAVAQVRKRFTEGHFGGPIILRSASAPEAANARQPAHSETNTQVAGVDEADIVKTDGNNIYALAGRQLRIFKSWPAADTTLEHSVDIEGFPTAMFLDGDKVTVFSGVQGDHFSPGPIGPGIPVARLAPIWWRPDAYTKVTILDVAGGTPRVVSETLVSGRYVNARRMGDSIRLVMNRQLNWPSIQYYPENVDSNSAEFDRAMDELEADAIRTVTGRALADWLPTSYQVVNGARVPLTINCRDYQVHSTGDELGLTSVVTINTSGSQVSLQDTSLLVSSRQIYQSRENLYITTDHQWSCYEDAGTKGQYTYVHKLDVSDPARTTYRASGGFSGGVLNQFSLDERDGYLRVASTIQRWSAETPEERSVSRVYVLGEQRGRRLAVVGQTPDMAPGERIFSSRFVGNRGFVVTFRQVDPLFTLDLSDPTNPTIVGELKIPGFSTYLHVLDEDHLFAIGNDFETDGTTRNGVALTIFDVSNLASPRLKHKAVIGSTRGSSEALYDHKAFTMFRQPGASNAVLAIPFTDWDRASDDTRYWGTFTSTLKVFEVSAGGIIENGEIDHSGLFEDNSTNRWGWWYRPNVRRGVFVEDFVYAISDAGLRVAETDDPTNIVAEVAAEPQYENPTPTDPTITDKADSKPGLRIPDANPTGISDTITLTQDIDISNLTVEVDVTHTYKGDLVVTIEHGGITETLHDRTGGSTDNIKRTFTTERFRGTNSKGVWTLKVVDTARYDLGVLVSWQVAVSGKASSGGTNPGPTVVTRTFENDQKVDVPDNNRSGISSDIEVPQAMTIESIEVEVDIRHTYRGDLYVVLQHDGKESVLHNKTGGSQDNLVLRVSPADFDGTDARGTWTLKIVDTARLDLGTLNRWSISVRGTQP